MPEISATEAARTFSDVLDAVEHRHEQFTIVRRGKVVAQIAPVRGGRGSDVKAVLRKRPDDPSWREELASLRSLVAIDERQ
jgi:prevent-host-death family protein